ncbi:MAG TPA: hypothetical protein VGD46_19415 [Rhizobacter sp.]
MAITFEKKPKAPSADAPSPAASAQDDTPPFETNEQAAAKADAAAAAPKKGKAAKKPSKKTLAAMAEAEQKAEPAPDPEADMPPEKVEQVQPQATVEVQHASGVKETHHEKVGEPVLKTAPMANVGLSMGYTHGLPAYSNIKFSVSLFMPSLTDDASLDATFERVEKWVDDRMNKLRTDLIEAGDEDESEG